MTDNDWMEKKGDAGDAAVVPGRPKESAFVEQIISHDGKAPAMPKGKDPLIPRDVDLIKQWIKEGAKDDTPASAKIVIDQDHPPVYTLPPVINALDYSPDGTLLAVSGYHAVL